MTQRALKMSERVTRQLQSLARKMGGGSVEVGWMEGATYPDGTPVAAVAFWNEFGHEGPFPAPARPAFRTMITNESPKWPARMRSLLKATNFNGPQVLAIMGEDISGALRDSIINLTEPKLSDTTLLLRKRFWGNPGDIRARDVVAAQRDVAKGKKGADPDGTQAKPLIWTGHELNSVTYRVMS